MLCAVRADENCHIWELEEGKDMTAKLGFEALHTLVETIYRKYGLPDDWSRINEAHEEADVLIKDSGWDIEEYESMRTTVAELVSFSERGFDLFGRPLVGQKEGKV